MLLLAATGVLSGGSYGAYAYLHDYDLYRGFPPPTRAGVDPPRPPGASRLPLPALGQRRSYLVYLPPGYAR